MVEDVEKLLDWYEEEGRAFPWRETENPYEILIAELMLQKTSASQVLPVYRGMIDSYPTPDDLSVADVDDIAEEIYSLGLQNTRAERLRELGRELVENHSGRVPRDKDFLMELPGVGEYISDAVLVMAFGEERAMIDVNVGRVLGRAFFGEEDYSPGSERIERKAEELLPSGEVREFDLSLIDLGALVCRPENPSCGECPLSRICEYFRRLENSD